MRRFKIFSIILAVVFVSFTSFKSNKSVSFNGGIYKWFIYDGFGDPSNPYSYRMAMFEPECNSNAFLCAIYAKVDFLGWLPTPDSLLELAISSGFFTQPYVGGYGEVR